MTTTNWHKYHPPVKAADVLGRRKRLTLGSTTLELVGLACGGVGSNRPFATGRRVDRADLLHRSFPENARTRHILHRNRQAGAWRVGFVPEWIAHEVEGRGRVLSKAPDRGRHRAISVRAAE